MAQQNNSFFRATGQTKVFVINWAIYMFLIIATTIYAYARLDFVRSGPPQEQASETPKP